jgi:hypothetical protein
MSRRKKGMGTIRRDRRGQWEALLPKVNGKRAFLGYFSFYREADTALLAKIKEPHGI